MENLIRMIPYQNDSSINPRQIRTKLKMGPDEQVSVSYASKVIMLKNSYSDQLPALNSKFKDLCYTKNIQHKTKEIKFMLFKIILS